MEIAVLHYDHTAIAIKAFAQGTYVLIEKPPGVYTKQALEMNDVTKKSGLAFNNMHNQNTNIAY